MTRPLSWTALLLACAATSGALAQTNLPGPSVPGHEKAFHLPMTNASAMTIQGPHRFLDVAGRVGYRPDDRKTRATVTTDVHVGPQGTLSFWFSPFEELDIIQSGGVAGRRHISLVSDGRPDETEDETRFGVYWDGGYPQLIARFMPGRFWSIATRRIGPFCYDEYLPLRKGRWYHIAVTWNREARLLEMYVNGVKVARNPFANAADFAAPRPLLRLGDPAVLMRHLLISSDALDSRRIQALYQQDRVEGDTAVEQEVARLACPTNLPPLDISRDGGWREAYRCSFTNRSDLDGWTFQTGPKYESQFKLEITPEGFRWQTPDPVAADTRGYMWCPKRFGDDVWVELDFRLESPRGLALLIIQAAGLHGEDVVKDLGLARTGSMDTMCRDYRNYHWEFMRRVDSLRGDVETQYVQKNPWNRLLHFGSVPAFEQNRWYRLRWVKAGNRLHGDIDGRTVFDLIDEATPERGPVLNKGRLVLRHMYQTTVTYRNLVVHEKQAAAVP